MIMATGRFRALFISATLVVASPFALGQSVCGDPFSEGGGARDYRTASQEARQIVERFHFTDDVKMMRRGASTNQLAADIAYTLRKFPNHYQALMTMGDYSLKVKLNPPPGAQYTVECWFDRALRFAPDDAMVKTVYGLYLIKRNKHKDAVAQLEAALAQAGDNANVHYNLGLAYFDLKQYDKALKSAHAAYRMGFPFPGLKNKLERVGAGREP